MVNIKKVNDYTIRQSYAPTFRIKIINHIILLRNLVSIHVENDSDLLLVGFTFI